MGKRLEAIKTHVEAHKREYIIAGTALAVGVAIGVVYATRRAEVNLQVSPKGIFYKSPVITEVHLERLGHPGNIIRCVETGEIFASQNRAATLLGLNAPQLSQHLRGNIPHVGGLHFEVLGEATR